MGAGNFLCILVCKGLPRQSSRHSISISSPVQCGSMGSRVWEEISVQGVYWGSTCMGERKRAALEKEKLSKQECSHKKDSVKQGALVQGWPLRMAPTWWKTSALYPVMGPGVSLYLSDITGEVQRVGIS